MSNVHDAAPDDEDLQHLYDEVLAGFSTSNDSPITLNNPNLPLGRDKDIESIYKDYGGGDDPTPEPPTYDQHRTTQILGQAPVVTPTVKVNPQAQLPSRNRSARPLPLPPGASGPSSPALASVTLTMPKPQPFMHPETIVPPPPPPPPSHAYPSLYGLKIPPPPELERPGSSNGMRRLPQAPGVNDFSGPKSNGRPGTSESVRAGLPSNPRPNYSIPLPPRSDSVPNVPSGITSPGNAPRMSAAAALYASAFNPGPTEPMQLSLQPDGQYAFAQQNPALSRSNSDRPQPPHLSSAQSYAADYGTSTGGVHMGQNGHSQNDSIPHITEEYSQSKTSMDSWNPSRTPSFGSPAQPGSSSSDPSSALSPKTPYVNGDAILSPLQNATVGRGNSVSSYASAGSQSSTKQVMDANEYQPSSTRDSGLNIAEGSGAAENRVSREKQLYMSLKGRLELHEEDDLDYEEEYEDPDDDRFVNLALLSHIAVRLKDKVPRGTHVKGGIPYPHAFTGKDIVSTIQALIQRDLLINLGISTSNRKPALQVARSLQSQLFFYEVEWGGRALQDGVEDVFMFLDDQEGGSDSRPEREELPTGVITMLTKCYSPSCTDESPCYAHACPRRQQDISRSISVTSTAENPQEPRARDWTEMVDKDVLRALPESEINRQTIIHKAISKEEVYVRDLDIIEQFFMKPIRAANPPVISPEILDTFMEEVFGNIMDVRECNRRLLEVMAVRQREQSPLIQRIGDIFLTAAAEFRLAYPIYVGNLPLAEKRLKDEIEANAEFRRFLEQCARHPELRRMDLKHCLNRPSEHLQKYPVLLEAIFNETEAENSDADFLQEAIAAIRKLSEVAQLRTFQSAMGKGPTSKLGWHDLVPTEFRTSIPKKEAKRQNVIFELIQGEMTYVKDLENFEVMYIRPLKSAIPPIIPRERLSSFLHDVFYNYAELQSHHRRLLDRLHEIQRDEHPMIHTITAPMMDAALNWHDAYMEYIPHYPIARFRIEEEMANNPEFKTFAEQVVKHPDARKLDMKAFINRPIPRLLRYSLLLAQIMDECPADHEDKEAIPQVLEVLKSLGKETEPGVKASEEKVEIWRYNENLIFKAGEAVDMDLLNENRSLIHTGKFLRQPENNFEFGGGWAELTVLLFDNYLVMTKPKEKDGAVKFYVNRRPIPLDLLTLLNFNDPPQQKGQGILRGLRGSEKERHESGPASSNAEADARAVYPCTIHHNGRLGGLWTVYAESAPARVEWKAKLEEAILLRKVVTDANKVFEIETLSTDTFLVPSIHYGGPQTPTSWSEETTFTGKVTCSIPFQTPDGRGLVAVGCAEGVWIGLRHDPRSLRRVLHLKMVTQCAMLEDFGIFLVLADKSLFAYHIEALVPSAPPTANASRTPQKLNGNKDVQFFSVGTLGGRTLIIYMKKKGLDSVFRVLEPVVGKIAEKTKTPGGFSRFGFGNQRSEWFRVYRDFFLPSESYDLIFLKAKIAILCSKGFEIMDLTDFKSVTIPRRDDARLQALARRCDSCKPIGMFRSSENEFLLCYDEFGLYVDRHGDPSRAIGTIEWEGTAERVAWHPPYILLFDSRFIEVRHVETGRLAQIIPGTDVRCLWDGRGSTQQLSSTPGPDGWQDGGSQDARVHAVMKANDSSVARSSKATAQHVFELLPTIPLYLPGSLGSPGNSTYFPQNGSPPTSPQLTPRHSWRS